MLRAMSVNPKRGDKKLGKEKKMKKNLRIVATPAVALWSNLMNRLIHIGLFFLSMLIMLTGVQTQARAEQNHWKDLVEQVSTTAWTIRQSTARTTSSSTRTVLWISTSDPSCPRAPPNRTGSRPILVRAGFSSFACTGPCNLITIRPGSRMIWSN